SGNETLLGLDVSNVHLRVFCQAEDGIRDWSVTGVQTCALPILLIVALAAPSLFAKQRPEPPAVWRAYAEKLEAGALVKVTLKDRSEERRVGKECRWRGRPGR